MISAGSYAGATLIVIGFAWLLMRLGLVERARTVNGVARECTATLSDRSLSDRKKEQAMRRLSGRLFGLFADITVRLVLALALPILLVWLIGFTRLWSFEGAIEASLTWQFILAGACLFVLVMFAGRRRSES